MISSATWEKQARMSFFFSKLHEKSCHYVLIYNIHDKIMQNWVTESFYVKLVQQQN